MTLLDLIKATPRAWEEFLAFYQVLIKDPGNNKLSGIDFWELPFEMQFGIFASFLKGQSLDLDFPDWDKEILISIICENFRIHENMMDHFS